MVIYMDKDKFRKIMSESKKKWWANASPEQLSNMKKKISKWSKKYNNEHKRTGSDAPGWKGGRYVESRKGYIYIYVPNHPLAKKNGKGGGGYYLEHRYVMEQHLGRILTQDEEVHHKNGIKDDNRLENLELVVKKMHFGVITCPHCQKEIKIK